VTNSLKTYYLFTKSILLLITEQIMHTNWHNSIHRNVHKQSEVYFQTHFSWNSNG